MKVLNVNMSLDPVTGGGTAERTLKVSRALAAAGVDCSVLTIDAGLPADLLDRDAGFALHVLPCVSKRFYLPRYRPAFLKQLVGSVDIVHLMNHWTVLNVMVGGIARRLNKPYVVCPAGALPVYGRSKIVKNLYNQWVGRRLVAQAAGQVAVSANEIPHFLEYGVEAARVTVIPNGINPADFAIRDDRGFRQRFGLADHPLFLFVGRLNRIKGPDLLLEAFARLKERLPRHHLVFVGPDGGMQGPLQEMAAGLDLAKRVHFLGYLGGGDKSQAYHAADLLVIPSRQEAMSIVALEAGVCGTPVLLTDQCGFDEVGEIGGGRVVAASVAGLAQGLGYLTADAARLRGMGEVLQHHVLKYYTWEIAAAKHLALFRKICQGDGSP